MSWGAVAGGAIGAAGSLLGGGGSSMPKFRPWSVQGGLLGTTEFDRKGKNVNVALTPEMQAIANSYLSTANRGSPTQGFQDFAMGDIQGMIPGLFGGALNASNVDANPYARFDSQMGGLAGGLSGMTNTANALGMQYASGGPIGGGMAQGMYGAGMGLLGERPQSYNDVAASRLALLREQAAPFEERAGLGLQQNLFNTGRLGTTGGSQNIEAFARGLGQADTSRQLDAQGFAEQLYGRDLSASLARNQMGAGLMGTGMQGLLSGEGLAGQLAAQYFGLGQSGTGMLGNMYGSQFGAAQSYNDIVNQRAQQRIQNAQGLFGFGVDLGNQDLATQQGAVNNYLGLNNALLGQADFGANMGRSAMGSGQPIQQGVNPLGGFLQGLGGAVSGMNLSSMFNSGGGMAPRPQSISQPFTPTFGLPTYNGPIPGTG